MRTLLTAALIAAGAVTAAAPAAAQSNRELRRDRQDIREEQRDLRDAYRRGDRGDVRDARGDLRDARQEYREDLRDRYGRNNWNRGDWRGWRDGHRDLYARGGWRAPYGYTAFRPGARLAPAYYGRGNWIADPSRYRLPRPVGYQRWVRNYDDVLLVDTRRGVVVDAIRGFYF